MRKYNFKVRNVVEYLQRNISRIVNESDIHEILVDCSSSPISGYVAVKMIEDVCPLVKIHPCFISICAYTDPEKISDLGTRYRVDRRYSHSTEYPIHAELSQSHTCLHREITTILDHEDSEETDILMNRVIFYHSMASMYQHYKKDVLIVAPSNMNDVYLGRVPGGDSNTRKITEYNPFYELTYAEVVEIGKYLKASKDILEYNPNILQNEDESYVTEIDLSENMRKRNMPVNISEKRSELSLNVGNNKIPITHIYDIVDMDKMFPNTSDSFSS